MKKIAVVILILLFSYLLFSNLLWAAEERKTITVKNENAELSNLTGIIGDQAIIRLYSELTTDDLGLWNDLMILKKKGIVDIKFFISSPGGYATTGFSLVGIIQWAQENGFKIKAYASGLVASAAVPVFLAFEDREAFNGTIFMIHEPSTEMRGSATASQFKATNEFIDLLRDQYFSILIDKTKIKDRDQWEKWERDTKWIGLNEAIEIGLVPDQPKSITDSRELYGQ